MKNCSNCKYGKRIYQFYAYRATRECKLYCENKQKVITSDLNCEQWTIKTNKLDFSKQRFDECEQDIKFLTQHFKDLKFN